MSDPELNATFLKSSERYSNLHKSVDLNATFEISQKSRSGARSALNCTFQIQDGSSSSSSNRSGRAIPCDSGGDDDQHSSASDSSFSSCNRLMNVGDVQNIARLQEESKYILPFLLFHYGIKQNTVQFQAIPFNCGKNKCCQKLSRIHTLQQRNKERYLKKLE